MTSGTPARAEDDVDEEHVETEVPVAVPAPSFANFGVSKAVVDALSMRNIDGTFEIQALVLADAIAGRDVLAKSRTGSGKTLAFAVPIVERLEHDQKSPTALILVPTRELATQVADEFRGIIDPKGMKVATVYGGVGLQDQGKRAAKADVIVATPGRLIDLVNRRLVKLDRVRISVLDEADRMLDMGFLPDVSKILAMLPPERQTMMFSATLDGEVGHLAQRFTRPYTPRTNGKAERFIQTLLREWAYRIAYPSSAHRTAVLERWLHYYNWHRRHSALNGRPPISRVLFQDDLLRLHS